MSAITWAARAVYSFPNGNETTVVLVPNPSHLEHVNPVVQGWVRADQDDRSKRGMPVQRANEAMAVLIHGDASFMGQGVVAEALNLSRLQGYTVDGAIHIICNNQVGFTTDADSGRSTPFSSDVAKGFGMPVVHM